MSFALCTVVCNVIGPLDLQYSYMLGTICLLQSIIAVPKATQMLVHLPSKCGRSSRIWVDGVVASGNVPVDEVLTPKSPLVYSQKVCSHFKHYKMFLHFLSDHLLSHHMAYGEIESTWYRFGSVYEYVHCIYRDQPFATKTPSRLN